MIDHTLITTPAGASLTVYVKQALHTITDEHPWFDQVLQELKQDLPDEDQLIRLLTVTSASTAGPALQQLSSHIVYDAETDKVLLDAERIDSSIAEHIRTSVHAGTQDFKPLVAFLERLRNNTSMSARRELYKWLSAEGLTITGDGFFIAYKGLTSESTSVQSGEAYVDGQLTEGQIPNSPGSTITMDRADVDDERGTACSMGLHVGTADFALHFGQKLIATVLVDPADVVAVPRSAETHKLRTCKYQVRTITMKSDFVHPGRNTVISDDEADLFDDEFDEDEEEHSISVTDFT